jgi:hypothetical protein
MNEQLEQVKINADNISSVLSRKKSSLRGIKVERKRLLLKQTDDKKKKRAEQKLESKKSPFGNSLKKIKKSTSTNTLFKGLGGNLMKFVSLLLLGVALNNLDDIKDAVTKAFKNIKEGLTTVSNVIKTIYEKTENFVDMFDNDKQREEDFKKIEEEYEKIKPLVDQFKSVQKQVSKAMDNLSGKSLGQKIESDTLMSGEKYDLINLLNEETGNIEPYFRIDKGNGEFEIINQKDFGNNLLNEIKLTIPNFMREREDNQWWDIADVFPNNVKYIDVYNATKDFNAKEELDRLRKTNPKRYSDTIIRVQPVIIDPE